MQSNKHLDKPQTDKCTRDNLRIQVHAYTYTHEHGQRDHIHAHMYAQVHVTYTQIYKSTCREVADNALSSKCASKRTCDDIVRFSNAFLRVSFCRGPLWQHRVCVHVCMCLLAWWFPLGYDVRKSLASCCIDSH